MAVCEPRIGLSTGMTHSRINNSFMGKLIAIGALIAGAYLVVHDNGPSRMSSGGGGSGAFSGYTGAAKPAISGIAGAAG